MPQDMLDLLRLDPGTRTMGRLMQEREWAYGDYEASARRVSARARRGHKSYGCKRRFMGAPS